MTFSEKEKLLGSLRRGREAVLAALEGLSPELAEAAPAPGRWTILQCAEHLAVSEDYLFSQVEKAERRDAPMCNPEREALIELRGLDRTRKFESPSEARPVDRFPTLDAALKHFLASRERTIRYVESIAEGRNLRAEGTAHPLIGPANCYEMLLMMAAHPLRHAQQIEEIKASFAA